MASISLSVRWLGASLALLPALASAQAVEAAAAPADYTLAGNVGVVSDYRFRGISNSNRKPALQAGLDFGHTASGLYGGVWASSVANAAFNNTDGYEFDASAGWRHQLTDELQIDTGFFVYSFPGSFVSYSAPSGITTKVPYTTKEIKLALNYGTINVTGWYSVGRYWSGFFRTDENGQVRDIRGTNYLEANWNPELGNGYTLNLHAGRQHFVGLSAADFQDVRVGVTKVFEGGWQASAAVLRNNGSRAVWTFVDPRDNQGRYAAGTVLVVGGQRNF